MPMPNNTMFTQEEWDAATPIATAPAVTPTDTTLATQEEWDAAKPINAAAPAAPTPEQIQVRDEAQAHKWAIRMRTFTGETPDYFAAVEDPERKRQLAEMCGDNEDFKKQLAVALHLADYRPEMLEKMDFSMLDQYAEAAFGKGMTGAQAYDQLRKLFSMERRGEARRNEKGGYTLRPGVEYKQDPDQWKITGATMKFFDEMYRTFSGASALVNRMFADDIDNPFDLAQPLRRAITPEVVRNYFRGHAKAWEEAAKTFGIASQYETLTGAPGGEGFFAGFLDDKGEFDFGKGAENFAWNFLYEAPYLALQIGLTYVDPLLGAAFMGVRSAGGEYADMTDAGKSVNTAAWTALGVGLVDAYLSYFIDTKIIRGMGEAEAKAGFRIFVKNLFKNAGKEGLEEVEEQIVGNAWRMATGGKEVYSFGEMCEALFDGVVDSFIMGFAMGFPMAAAGGAADWRLAAARDLQARRIEDFVKLMNYRQALLQIDPDKLTVMQRNDLERIARMQELGDVDTMRDILFTEALRAENARRKMKDTSGSLTEEDIAAEARSRAALDRKFVHNPDDTRRTLENLRGQLGVPDERIVAVESIDDLPDELRARAKRKLDDSGNGDFYGFYDSGTDTVYVNVNKTPPHLVAPILWHEYLTHRGLRKVLGDANMNSLLDEVAKDYASEIAASGLLEKYSLDWEKEAHRREAAEEFLARHAEEMSLRLTWAWDNESTGKFRKLLNGLRKRLSPVLPRAYLTYTSDARMARMLAYALRPFDYDVKRGKAERAAGDVRFAVNKNGETIFMVQGKKGQLTISQILADNTIPEYAYILDANGSRDWAEITPDVAAAGGKIGIQALPIRLCKGRHTGSHQGFGLAHLEAEHGEYLRKHGYRDIAQYLTDLFTRPNVIYAYASGGTVLLEVISGNRPQNVGVIELKKNDGCYTIITAFPRNVEHYNIRGKEVWRRPASHSGQLSSPNSTVNTNAGQQATSRPKSAVGVGNVAGATVTANSKPATNIHPFGKKSSGNGGNGVNGQPQGNTDAEYMEAVKRGDMETAQRLVNEAMAQRGYNTGDAYRLQHRAPNRLAVSNDPNGPNQNIRDWKKLVPADYFIHPEYYTTGELELQAAKTIKRALASGDGTITMYRAVAIDSNSHETGFRNGDWITPVREYAELEGKLNNGAYRIIEAVVPLDNVFWDGNSPAEFGYDDGQIYAYADTENYRKLADPVTYDDDGNVIPLSQRFNRKKDDIRFAIAPEGESGNYVEPTPFIGSNLLEEFDDETVNNMRNLLLVMARDYPVEVYEKAQQELADNGYNVTAAQARSLASLAVDEVKARARRLRKRADDDYITGVDEYVNVLSGHYDINFKINFNQEFRDEEKSGTWVETRKKTKEGIPADEAARVLSREWGREVTTSELYEHFNGLNRRDILGKRTEEHRAQLEAMLAAELENDEMLWNEVQQGKIALTPDLIENHPNIARWLRKKIAKSAFMSPEELAREFYKHINTKEVAGITGDPEFLRSLLSEAEADLDNLKKKLRDDRANAIDLQKQAQEFARRHLPEEARGEFITSIVNLAKLSTKLTPQNPQGARMRAFEKLLDKIKARSEELRYQRNREALDKRLSEVSAKVNQSRRLVGTRDLGTQQLLDGIVEISRLPAAEISRRIEEQQALHDQALNDGTDASAPEEEIMLLSTFGNLDEKSADDLAGALKLLNGIAADGRQKLLAQLERRRAADQAVRDWIIRRVTDDKGIAVDQKEFDTDWKNLEKVWGATREGLFSLLKLEDFIYLMATNRQTGDWLESPVGKIFQKIHTSAVAQDTALRKFADFRTQILRECLGAKNDTAAVMKLANYRKRIESTGIFRHSATLRDIEYKELSLAEAREMLADHDAGKPTPLEDYQAEFLRDRLASLDLRMDRSYKRPKEDGVTEEIFTQMDKLDGKNDFETVSYPVVTFKDGDGYEMRNLNRMEALYLHLMWQQRDVRYKMRFNGYTDETMRQVEKFLTPELVKLGDEMRLYLNSVGLKLDAINRVLYHAKLPLVEHYFPAVYKVDRNGGNAARLSPDDPNAGRVPTQFLPGALKARNAHVRELKICDALQVFEGHVRQTAHYIAWAETAREVRSVLLNSDVKKALTQVFGPEFTRQMQSAVVDALNGGNLAAADANKLIKGFNKLYASAVSMKMLFSYMSGIKQTMSAVSYLNDVPPAAFMSGVARALEHPVETFRILDESPYLRNRLYGGPDMWTGMVLDKSNRNATVAGLWGGQLMDWGSVFTRYGDMVPVVLAGASVYYYQYDKAIKDGFSPAEAKKHALLRWEMSTESLQQSRAVHNQNAVQRSNAKFLTAFKSSQILNAQRPLREAIAYYFFGEQHAGLKRDVKAYDEYLAQVAVTKKLTLTPAEKKILQKFYKDFPLGKTIKNRWGETLTFAPLDEFKVEDYIHHFAVKRGKDASGAKTERFSESYLSLFEELQETLKNPDERILTVTDTGDPRINYLKKISTKTGNHYVIAAVAQDGRIVPWTHMDSADKYIEKQRAAEKLAVEKYGLVDGEGNRVYMTYDEYLKKKKDAPLYLATAATHQSMTPQTAISDRVPNIARPGNLSSDYTGAPPPRSRKAVISGTLLTMVAVAAFINAAGAVDRRLRGKDRDKDPEDTIGDILANSALDPLSIFPVIGSVAPALLALATDRRVLNSDRLYFGDDIVNAAKGGKTLLDNITDGDFEFDEEAFDAATDILRGLGLWLPIPRAVGSLAYRAKRLYQVYDNLTE